MREDGLPPVGAEWHVDVLRMQCTANECRHVPERRGRHPLLPRVVPQLPLMWLAQEATGGIYKVPSMAGLHWLRAVSAVWCYGEVALTDRLIVDHCAKKEMGTNQRAPVITTRLSSCSAHSLLSSSYRYGHLQSFPHSSVGPSRL